jgi:hypothetical protein
MMDTRHRPERSVINAKDVYGHQTNVQDKDEIPWTKKPWTIASVIEQMAGHALCSCTDALEFSCTCEKMMGALCAMRWK